MIFSDFLGHLARLKFYIFIGIVTLPLIVVSCITIYAFFIPTQQALTLNDVPLNVEGVEVIDMHLTLCSYFSNFSYAAFNKLIAQKISDCTLLLYWELVSIRGNCLVPYRRHFTFSGCISLPCAGFFVFNLVIIKRYKE